MTTTAEQEDSIANNILRCYNSAFPLKIFYSNDEILDKTPFL